MSLLNVNNRFTKALLIKTKSVIITMFVFVYEKSL